MKIVKLTAENIKRIKAVEINPEGTLQVVAGRNGQGKSSVLDAIWYALGGGPAKKGTARPIRDGEDSARVTLDLGDLLVTRTWTSNDKSTLKVSAKDGAQYSSPQSMLDGLVGKLSFDPLAFTQLSAKEQRDALIDLVDMDTDLDELDRKRATLYDKRAEIGRRGKALGTVDVDETLPTEEQSATAIIAQIRDAQSHNENVTAWKRQRDENAQKARDLTRQIESLTAELERVTANEKDATEWLEKNSTVDTAPLEASLATVEDTNAKIRANNQARDTLTAQQTLRTEYEDLTSEISAIDAEKQKALAGAQFPVDGLGFDADGVTYQGVPFSQASSAEQIRVSLAMAMALNPELRVIRIKDGSLLDRDNMALIEQMAADKDFQIWIERVSDSGAVGVVIEDGEVQS